MARGKQTGKQTPMMRQYQQLKQQYKDKILLFRMGDFYETFDDDAETTSRVLNIALATRDKSDDPTPLAGFPHHALDQYLYKLVKAGYNVAVAEQVEDPKLAKGIVRREVVKVVTPGTLTDEKGLGDKKNNYLASVYQDKRKYGLAVCDLSTGEFKITETANESKMIDEISRIAPSEILVPPKQDFSIISNHFLQPAEEFEYSYNSAKSTLTSQLNVKSLASFGIVPYKAAVIAAGALIDYLQNTQKADIAHVTKIQFFDIEQNMILDLATIRNLDLLDSPSELGPQSSLLAVLDHTTTSMGGRMLRQWILHPLIDATKIDQRQSCVEYFYTNPDELSQTQDLLKQIADLERLGGKLGLNSANARDLINLANSLKNTISLAKLLSEEEQFKTLAKKILSIKTPLQDTIKYIEKSIADDPPLSITEGGIVKDGFNKKVDEIRQGSSDSKAWIKNLEATERERTGISSLKVRFNKVFGYYIEVTNTHKDKVPEDYVRKQTLVNGERYITPELKEKEQIVLNADEKLAALEYECFQEIRSKVLKSIKEIQSTAEVVAEIDVLASLAYSARVNNYTRPEIHQLGTKKGAVSLKSCRHPIVERISEEEFISNDIEMDRDGQRLLILTGPNMSGKSTYIRQAALLILMAQIGSFVPAKSAEISVVDRIFTRVGASDDLSAGRSTFMVEMDEAANIINNATQHSFIVLDEVGRGTSTYDGVSIAWAIAEHIHDSLGARCVFATHYHELLKLESELDAVKNYNVAVLEEKDEIIFLRKIEAGGTDRSYGIYVAQMAGLPESVVNRASEILEGFEQENMFGVRSEPKSEKSKGEQPAATTDTVEDSQQLTFMDTSLNGTMPNLFKELKDTDPNNLTPIQALQLLEKWKKRLGS